MPHSVQNVLREVDDSDLDALLDTALRPQHAARKPVVEEPKPISALTSLVAEEEAWLHRAREMRQERPAGEAVAPVAVAPVAAPVVEPVVAPPPPVAPEVAVAPAPVVPVMENEVPTEVTPPPVAPEVRPQRSRWLMVGGLLGTGILGAIAGALVMRPAERSEPVAQQQAPAPVAAAPAPVVAAPVTPAPVTPAPVTPAPVTPAPAVAAPAPAPVVAAPPPVVAAPAPQPAPVAAPPVVARPPVEKAPAVVAKKEPRPIERIVPRSEPVPEKKKVAAVERSGDELDDDFARELGFTSGSSQKKSTQEQDSRPESLSTSDILQVVAAHKGDVVSCLQQHSPPKPESGQGRFVVRWRLRTDGGATDVLLEDEHLKGSPFAKCIEAQVRSWKFSPHRVQRREPVRFPFTY